MRHVALAFALLASAVTASAAFASTGKPIDISPTKAHVAKADTATTHHRAKVKMAKTEHAAKKPAAASTKGNSPTK